MNTLSFAAPHFPFSIVNSSLEKLVNLAFLLAYAPDLPTFVQDVLPILNLASAIMLGLLVPVSIVAVEAAHQVADAARLALLVDVTTLQGIVQAGQQAREDQHAAGRLSHAPPLHAPPHAGPHRHRRCMQDRTGMDIPHARESSTPSRGRSRPGGTSMLLAVRRMHQMHRHHRTCMHQMHPHRRTCMQR